MMRCGCRCDPRCSIRARTGEEQAATRDEGVDWRRWCASRSSWHLDLDQLAGCAYEWPCSPGPAPGVRARRAAWEFTRVLSAPGQVALRELQLMSTAN